MKKMIKDEAWKYWIIIPVFNLFWKFIELAYQNLFTLLLIYLFATWLLLAIYLMFLSLKKQWKDYKNEYKKDEFKEN